MSKVMFFGLMDCNNFYVSCQRVFDPGLANRPIIVLSNNDGCVISRSNEAKVLGIKMGEPVFKIKDLIKKHGVIVFSSNYMLYGDMSCRVMATVSELVAEMEIYSIDEAFLNLSGMEFFDLRQYGQKIVNTVTKGTGIPVSLGIAPTKTLAKAANKFAKKYKGYKGVCVIDTEEKRIKALQKTEIDDVWGIGRQYAKKLKAYGIATAYDFTQMPREWVRKEMTVTGERLWRELHGESCIELETMPADKKQICTSRSFGTMVTDLPTLSEAVSNYAASCARKLRKQKSCAAGMMIFIHTNHFRADLPQYCRNTTVKFSTPTNSTAEIIHHANEALKLIFRDGFRYKKAGVIITEIISENAMQHDLFDTTDRDKYSKLYKVMDSINGRFNERNIFVAAQGSDKKWHLRQENLSPCYTTRIEDIIKTKE